MNIKQKFRIVYLTLRNMLEKIKSKINEAQDWKSELEDKVKNNLIIAAKWKKKYFECMRKA